MHYLGVLIRAAWNTVQRALLCDPCWGRRSPACDCKLSGLTMWLGAETQCVMV